MNQDQLDQRRALLLMAKAMGMDIGADHNGQVVIYTDIEVPDGDYWRRQLGEAQPFGATNGWQCPECGQGCWSEDSISPEHCDSCSFSPDHADWLARRRRPAPMTISCGERNESNGEPCERQLLPGSTCPHHPWNQREEIPKVPSTATWTSWAPPPPSGQ
jgi:hypothetical protein